MTDSEALPDSAAPRLLEELIRQAQQASASDIHLQMTAAGTEITLRLDGLLAPASVVPRELGERLIGRIKFLARLKTYQESLPQEGRIDAASVQAASDIRVSTYPAVTGEKIVLRLFSAGEIPRLAELGLPVAARAALELFLAGTSGLLLLTGPAGSGKTTTIYACLRYLVGLGGRHIITVEDPAEQIVPGVMQTEVNEARGLTFASAIRHLLRQDPQVLVIGETRDPETAQLMVRAALTGHLVISTLHAGSCQGVVERLLALGTDRHAVFSVLGLIMNQRLLRKRCRHCAGAGCEGCLKTGYRGRLPVTEHVLVDDALRASLQQTGPASIQPVPTLEAMARELIRQGDTDEREFCRMVSR